MTRSATKGLGTQYEEGLGCEEREGLRPPAEADDGELEGQAELLRQGQALLERQTAAVFEELEHPLPLHGPGQPGCGPGDEVEKRGHGREEEGREDCRGQASQAGRGRRRWQEYPFNGAGPGNPAMDRLTLQTLAVQWAPMAMGGGCLPAGTATGSGEPAPVEPGVRTSSLPGKSVPYQPSKARGTYTALVLSSTAVRRRPAGKAVAWRAKGTTRWSGSEQRLMVLSSRRADGEMWLKVRLPIRPNGLLRMDAPGQGPARAVEAVHVDRPVAEVAKALQARPCTEAVQGGDLGAGDADPAWAGPPSTIGSSKETRMDSLSPWVPPITAHSPKTPGSSGGGPGVGGVAPQGTREPR